MMCIIATLLGLGCVAVYSATAVAAAQYYGTSFWFLVRHVAAIAVGVALAIGCLAMPLQRLRGWAKALVLVGLILIAVVSMVGPEIGGAQRWFRIGRLSIQPSEFAKLALVLYVADFLARKRERIQEFRDGFLPPILITGVMAGLVLLQPDLGTAIVMGSVVMMLLIIARARWRHVGLTMVVGAVALVVLIAGAEYRRRRLLAFLNPWQDPLGAGFQILQSYLALGHGGWFGQGLGASMQKLYYLPGGHTDFIFAIIGEELGLVGTSAVIALYALFIGCGIRMALAVEDWFHKYLICGCVGLIGLEAMVHMAVVTGVLPTKGLPLPLMSYGGTSMVGNLIACALILNASRASHTAGRGVSIVD